MKALIGKSGFVVLIAVIALLAAAVLRGPHGMDALAGKRKQIQTLQERNATLAAENERKRLRIERLKHSRAEQELEIRERLKMLRPGETQFILPDQPKPEVEETKPQ